MISLQDIQDILAQEFFDGNTAIAGIIMYIGVMALVVVFFAQKNLILAFGLMLPVTLIFSMLGVLPDSFTLIMMIVFLIGVGMKFKQTYSEG